MPQTPLGTMYGIRRTFAQLKIFAAQIFAPTPPSTGSNVAANFDPMGNLIISGAGGYSSVLSAAPGYPGSVIAKAGPAMLIRVIVNVGGTGPGSIFDTASTALQAGQTGMATANLVAYIPTTPGIYEYDFPCLNGLVIQPGPGQQTSIAYQ